MTPRELLQAGRLDAAWQAQERYLASCPGDLAEQLLRLDLLLYRGALAELTLRLAELPETEARSYAELVVGEQSRRRVLRGRQTPQRLPPSQAKHLYAADKALRWLRRGQTERAVHLLEKAQAAAPLIHGHLDGQEFVGLRDTDELLALVLELLVQGTYVWVPWESIRRLDLAPPESPRDLLYRPVTLQLSDGSCHTGHTPVVYYDTYRRRSAQLRLGRATDWWQPHGGPLRGLGQHLWLVGLAEVSILEVTTLEVTPPRRTLPLV